MYKFKWLSTKQNIFTCVTPLIKTDVSNNMSFDLSAYDTIDLRNTALNSYVLTSTANSTYATINNLNTNLSRLNASNITSGTLTISRGGIGTTTLSANQILIGNAATSILQSANLTWNTTSSTLSASNVLISSVLVLVWPI